MPRRAVDIRPRDREGGRLAAGGAVIVGARTRGFLRVLQAFLRSALHRRRKVTARRLECLVYSSMQLTEQLQQVHDNSLAQSRPE